MKSSLKYVLILNLKIIVNRRILKSTLKGNQLLKSGRDFIKNGYAIYIILFAVFPMTFFKLLRNLTFIKYELCSIPNQLIRLYATLLLS